MAVALAGCMRDPYVGGGLARVSGNWQIERAEDRGEVVRFVDELAASQSVYVRIDSLNAGRTATEFQLNGAQAAIDAGFADCPLHVAAPATQTSALR
jgi:hypothetical protein